MIKVDKNFPGINKLEERYLFNQKAVSLKGKRPDFLEILKKNVKKDAKVLDLGCGSGELTLGFAKYVKEIVGIDGFSKYIETALKDKDKLKIKNVDFLVADAINLPYSDETFDLVYSSRGPLSENLKMISESYRVLKTGGILIEETIGEKDKIELKELFGRGQDYPINLKKEDKIKKLLNKLRMTLLDSYYYKDIQLFDSMKDVIDLLERAPIIPNFDKNKDKLLLENVEKNIKNSEGKIPLSIERFYWIAKK